MLKRSVFVTMLSVTMLCGVGNMTKVNAGSYAVGTIFKTSEFPGPQPKYGVRGYIVLEPDGIPSGDSIIYHTMTNHSLKGSETIIMYNWGASGREIKYSLYRWDTGNEGFYGTKLIGTSTGAIDSNFQKYIKTINLNSEDKKCIAVENVSDWNGSNQWHETSKIAVYNGNPSPVSWETVLDITWNGGLIDNYATQTTQGVWAGAIELTGSTITSWGSKEIGNYLMDFIGPSGVWTPMASPLCCLRTEDVSGNGCEVIGVGNEGMKVINTSPSPGYWLGRKP